MSITHITLSQRITAYGNWFVNIFPRADLWNELQCSFRDTERSAVKIMLKKIYWKLNTQTRGWIKNVAFKLFQLAVVLVYCKSQKTKMQIEFRYETRDRREERNHPTNTHSLIFFKSYFLNLRSGYQSRPLIEITPKVLELNQEQSKNYFDSFSRSKWIWNPWHLRNIFMFNTDRACI